MAGIFGDDEPQGTIVEHPRSGVDTGEHFASDRRPPAGQSPAPTARAITFFTKEDPNALNGFDARAQWQMVPLGDTRTVVLVGGQGLVVDVSPPPGLSVVHMSQPTAHHRIIELTGSLAGTFTLRALDRNNTLRAKLEVAVLPARTIRIAHFILSDGVGHSADYVNEADVPVLHEGANRILAPQANVFLTFSGASKASPVGSVNLGDAVDVFDAPTNSELTQITSRGAADTACRDMLFDQHQETMPATLLTST